jgi:hypothetical protein
MPRAAALSAAEKRGPSGPTHRQYNRCIRLSKRLARFGFNREAAISRAVRRSEACDGDLGRRLDCREAVLPSRCSLPRIAFALGVLSRTANLRARPIVRPDCRHVLAGGSCEPWFSSECESSSYARNDGGRTLRRLVRTRVYDSNRLVTPYPDEAILARAPNDENRQLCHFCSSTALTCVRPRPSVDEQRPIAPL